jgi:hypothetical protein
MSEEDLERGIWKVRGTFEGVSDVLLKGCLRDIWKGVHGAFRAVFKEQFEDHWKGV